ncbi:MAG: hypothetical protein ABEJ04_01320 [Halobacteriaceae archaeon]
METKKIGTSAAVVGVVGLAGHFLGTFVPSYLSNALTDGSAPGWAPTFGTPGETALVYSYVSGALGPVLLLGLGLAFGYVLGSRVDVSRAFRRLARAVFAGSALGVVLAMALLGIAGEFVSSTPSDAGSVFLFALATTRFAAEVVLPLTVATLTGAAFVHFDAGGVAPRRPTDADGPPSPSTGSDSRTGEDERRTHSTR